MRDRGEEASQNLSPRSRIYLIFYHEFENLSIIPLAQRKMEGITSFFHHFIIMQSVVMHPKHSLVVFWGKRFGYFVKKYYLWNRKRVFEPLLKMDTNEFNNSNYHRTPFPYSRTLINN